jgi:hypothetical protein
MESKVYRMGGGSFALEMLFRYAGIWMLLLSVTALTGIILGITIDLRWFVIGLMVVFVVIPMVLAFLYYYFGLRRECFINTIPHTVVVNNAGVTVRMHLPDNGSDEPGAEGSSAESDKEPRIREEFFPYVQMQPYRIGSKSVIIPLRTPAKGFIWIPADAFEEQEELAEALQLIDTRIAELHPAKTK